MATYKQIQDDIKKRFGRTVKTCWIADVQAFHGLTQRAAPNRISPSARVHPCPIAIRPVIEDSLRKFEMIPGVMR
jgi:hypothetical protein